MTRYFSAIMLVIIMSSCNNRIYKLRKLDPSPSLSHAINSTEYNINLSRGAKTLSKSFTYIDTAGKEIIINEAVKDEKSGEMVSLRYLNEIVVSAKSHNISERNGLIRLDFMVKIPSALQNSRWQIDLLPVLSRGDDTIHFCRILLSGKEFKREQQKGYKRYEKYLRTIIPDDADFLEFYTDLPNLILFLERNLPNSKILAGNSNDQLETLFGVTEKNIVDHYVKQWLIYKNEKRKSGKERYFNKYVKNPYITGVKLDSIIRMGNGDFAYHYSQEIVANENSSRLMLNLYGQVREISGICIKLRPSDTLVYNVSSMVNFIDDVKKYKKKIVERKVISSMSASVEFKTGKAEIDESLSGNSLELEKIRIALKNMLEDNEFILDSIILTSSSSPEGPFMSNKRLSSDRASSIQNYCEKYIQTLNEDIITYEIGKTGSSIMPRYETDIQRLIVKKSIPEDWETLKLLVMQDSNILNKKTVLECFKIQDPDLREKDLAKKVMDYIYIREKIYPFLRRVNFTFHLHRKGMVKDTIQSTEPDSLYMQAINLLKERRYEDALMILKDYNDFNTVIAHISLGHDLSAEKILLSCPDSAYKVYLLAILAARKGDEEQAVKYFLRSKELNHSMAYRGSLDPEISYLIRKYDLNKDLFK